MCNSAQANPTNLGRETARLWTRTKPDAPPAPFAHDPAQMKAFAGMYRRLRDNTVAELRFRDNKLALDGSMELIPTVPGKFQTTSGASQYEFDPGTPIRLRVITPTGETRLEKVPQAKPTAAEMADYVGDYSSSETGTTLAVALNAKQQLTYRIGTGETVILKPTFRDAFATPTTASIYFVRDSTGQVTALSAGESRVWDLRFTRQR